jgi:hypothetical protein
MVEGYKHYQGAYASSFTPIEKKNYIPQNMVITFHQTMWQFISHHPKNHMLHTNN